MEFEKLGLAKDLLKAVAAKGYHTATPIQAQAIPTVLEGHDLMGCAQTGTGKTAAFALPTLHRLSVTSDAAQQSQPINSKPQNGKRNGKNRGKHNGPARKIRCLILAPTRELAHQIGDSFWTYGKFTGLRHTVIYGGVGQNPQVRALRTGVDTLIATPGRLLDLMNQGFVDLTSVEVLILDEADQMLDMGFIHDLRKIVKSVPLGRQTLMFSATMPPEIRNLAKQWLVEPKHIEVARVAAPAELVEQSIYHVDARNKTRLLVHLLNTKANGRVLVFSRTKHGADKIVKQLSRVNIKASAIHGNKSQNARRRALDAFKSERPPVLVATDVAARGLDIEAVSHVINYELPEVPELYVHRIGRTGRAGATGVATSFCGPDERGRLRMIERLTRQTIDIADDQPDFPPAQEKQRSGTSQGDGKKPANGAKRAKPKKKYSKYAKGAKNSDAGGSSFGKGISGESGAGTSASGSGASGKSGTGHGASGNGASGHGASGHGASGKGGSGKKSKFGGHAKGPSAGGPSKRKQRPSGGKNRTTARSGTGAK
jgi:ATP-dependent RNA helicase RhlE